MSFPYRSVLALAISTTVGTLGLASAAGAATPKDNGASVSKTRVCVTKKTKRARVVRTTQRCVSGETRMTWNSYESFVNSSASSDSGASSQGSVGPAGPQGLTGDTGARGSGGATGAQGVSGPAGPTGATGATGEKGAAGTPGAQGGQGATGPSDIYMTIGAAGAVSGSEQTRATLTLPAGSYLLLGQANAFSSASTGQFLISCWLRDRGTEVGESSSSINDSTADGTSVAPDAANLFMTAPLVTDGGSVTLSCRGIFGLPLVDGVKLTAIRTGALHIQ